MLAYTAESADGDATEVDTKALAARLQKVVGDQYEKDGLAIEKQVRKHLVTLCKGVYAQKDLWEFCGTSALYNELMGLVSEQKTYFTDGAYENQTECAGIPTQFKEILFGNVDFRKNSEANPKTYLLTQVQTQVPYQTRKGYNAKNLAFYFLNVRRARTSSTLARFIAYRTVYRVKHLRKMGRQAKKISKTLSNYHPKCENNKTLQSVVKLYEDFFLNLSGIYRSKVNANHKLKTGEVYVNAFKKGTFRLDGVRTQVTMKYIREWLPKSDEAQVGVQYKSVEAQAIRDEAEKEAEVVEREHTATYLKFEIQDLENEFKAMGDNQPNADGEEYDEWMERYISLANKINDAREELTTNGLELVELRK